MVDYSRAALEIGKGDLAASWVVQIINTTTWVASLAPDPVQEELFGRGPALVCGVVNVQGTARKVAGGYRVSGKWPYSSGSRQADWMLAGCRVETDDGEQRPGLCIAYMSMQSLSIADTWFVTGLQGTGSDTVVAEDVFVPDHMLVGQGGVLETRKKHTGESSDNYPVMPVGRMTNLAQLLGGAQRMLELVEADVIRKPLIGTTYQKKSDSGVYVHDIGRIAGQLSTAELILFDAYRRFDERAAAGAGWSDRELAHSRAGGAQVVGLIHRSIEELMFISGSSAFALSNPLQRYWRDIHIALRHILHIPQIAFEHYGRQRLGLKPDVLPPGAV
jgi:3-hydroxy-9,10-secoandrosta-1,3,5(10)-triene-9,17-dione monooxygenase